MTVVRPISDYSTVVNWTSTEATLWEALNDAIPSDSTYINSSVVDQAYTIMKLDNFNQAPTLGDAHIIRVRALNNINAESFEIALIEDADGANTILHTVDVFPSSSGFQTFNFVIPEVVVNSITSLNDLYFGVRGLNMGGRGGSVTVSGLEYVTEPFTESLTKMIKVDGVWKNIQDINVLVNGEWKKFQSLKVCLDDEWKNN